MIIVLHLSSIWQTNRKLTPGKSGTYKKAAYFKKCAAYCIEHVCPAFVLPEGLIPGGLAHLT